MTSDGGEIRKQLNLIRSAMIRAGVWSDEIPPWIHDVTSDQLPDIWQWLQYIYLPIRLTEAWYRPHYIAPIISPYLNTTPELQKILQLVIELDSLSPTFEKSKQT